MSRTSRGSISIAIIAVALSAPSTSGSAAPGPGAGAPPTAVNPLANLPLTFVENRGTTDARVRFFARGARHAFYLTPREIVLAFLDESATGEHAIAMRFIGANPNAAISGVSAQGTFNYLHGSDPSRWQTGVPSYSTIVYRDLWPRVDLHVRGGGGTLKYEFHVAPGAAPAAIRLAYDGASSLAVDAGGALQIGTAMGALRDAPPASYQVIDSVRVPVASRYVLDEGDDGRRFGFGVGAYRHDRELVIDPGIEFSTFLGGSSHEMPGGTAVDASGNVYVAGFTQSPDFPTTAGAFKRTGAAQNSVEAFVTKMNPAGTALLYSTFIGGSDFDWARRIAIDASGNAYIAGQTKSADFPTTAGAFSRSLAVPPNCPRCFADNYDAFVLKLNATGSALLYSTYLGGTDIDDARGIAVDSAGNAYVTGETVSLDFPTTAGSFHPASRGSYDMFVTKLNPTGSALVYSTFLGGSAVDDGERIAVDSGGRAVVLGFSSSADFPTTPGAYDTTPNGDFDVTITKLNAAGSALVFSTLLGGSASDSGGGLALDAAGNIYVSGGTSSLDFPTTPGAFDTSATGGAFIAKLNPTATTLIWSTLLAGPSGGAGASAVAPDASGNVWITGTASSADFPVTANAVQRALNGVSDAFISEVSADGAALLYSTFLGGRDADGGEDVAIDPNGKVIVVGHTYSLDFPATAGAFDTVFNGDPSIFWGDAWVTKIDPNATTNAPPAGAPVPAAPALLSPPNADTPPQPITFDWSDVAGAASYTIQIDDSSAFTSPLVRNVNVTSSMYATSGLNTVTHFWRVRGVNVNGVAGAWSAVRSFTPQAAPPPATLTTIDTNPSSVVGGNASTTTVVLSTGAPFGGAVVGLSSSNPQVASVPASVTIPENGFTGTATITTAPVSVNTTVTITASYNGATRTATLLVTNGSTTATLQSLVVSPSSVTGGSPTQGVVTLSSAAPPGGATVALSSSNGVVAIVPANVTVAPGATNVVFSISTTSVSASTSVTISASYAGTTKSATLTVNSAAPPPPPSQTAALTLSVTGRSGVHVTSTPTGLNVVTGTTGSASFTVGASITLTVGDGRDAIFSGACTKSKSKSCTFTLNGAASVTANVQ